MCSKTSIFINTNISAQKHENRFKSMAQWVAFVSVGVGECLSEDSFVCFGTKPTQRASTRDFLQD